MLATTFFLSIAALLALCAGQPAGAEESGSVELLESYVHDYTTLEHAGRTVTAGPLEGTATVIKSSGALFAEGGSLRIACVAYAKSSDAGLDLEAPCTLTDESGDKVYLMSERRAGDVAAGGGGRGVQRIVGGTGRYAGVTGECPYTTSYLQDRWVVSRVACTWRRP